MLFDMVASTPALAAALASILAIQRYGASSTAIKNEVERFFGPSSFFGVITPNDILSGGVITTVGRTNIVLCQGIGTADQASALLNGYYSAGTTRDPYGINPYVLQGARLLAVTARNNLTLPADGWLYAGHSFGGAVVEALAVLHGQVLFPLRRRAVTFGSPRPGDARMANYLSNVDLARFFNVGDPIPRVPPRASEEPTVSALLPASVFAPLEAYSQYGEGWQIDAQGELTETLLPPIGSIPTSVSVIGWAAGILQTPIEEHSISTYAARLAMYQVLTSQTPPVDPLSSAPQIAAPESGTATHQVGNPPVASIAYAVLTDAGKAALVGGSNGSSDFVAAVSNAGTGPGGQPYYAARVGKTHGVFWAGGCLMQGMGGKRARRIASHLNSALNGWNESTKKDVGAMDNSLTTEFS